jgi:hypothetical protein
VKASAGLESLPAIRLGLASDKERVLVTVWDGNSKPVNTPVISTDELPDLETEGGRGLFLVESLSVDWGVHWLENASGKVVWSVVVASEEDITAIAERRRHMHVALPRRMPATYPLRRSVEIVDDPALLRKVWERLRKWE